jgi:hypothetical protein
MMKMKPSNRSLAPVMGAVSLVLVGAALPRPAAAADHVLPWTACRQSVGEQDNVQYANNGLTFVNPTGGDDRGVCNLPRDNPDSVSGLAAVEVAYLSTQETFQCELYAFDRWSGPAQPSSGAKRDRPAPAPRCSRSAAPSWPASPAWLEGSTS